MYVARKQLKFLQNVVCCFSADKWMPLDLCCWEKKWRKVSQLTNKMYRVSKLSHKKEHGQSQVRVTSVHFTWHQTAILTLCIMQNRVWLYKVLSYIINGELVLTTCSNLVITTATGDHLDKLCFVIWSGVYILRTISSPTLLSILK